MKTESPYAGRKYTSVIAVKQMSAGNAEVGDVWIETKSFPDDTPIRTIMEWAENCSGKLILTWDEATEIATDVPDLIRRISPSRTHL